MSAVVASSDAYIKALLHCYKYPTQAVLGVLVGKRINSGSSDCYVTDAYPLFHSLPVSGTHPILEVAYAHCQAAARTSGLTLLGVYLANERLDDRGISKEVTRSLLESFVARLGLAGNSKDRLLVWFIDNETMTSPPSALSITSFYYEPGLYETSIDGPGSASSAVGVPRPAVTERDGSSLQQPLASLTFGSWNSDTLAPEATVSTEAVIEATTSALEAFAQYRLVDLEDHLENPEANYLEQPLPSLIARK